jgi:hypothetical protein
MKNPSRFKIALRECLSLKRRWKDLWRALPRSRQERFVARHKRRQEELNRIYHAHANQYKNW